MNPFDEMVLLPKEAHNKLVSQALHGSAPSMQKELEDLYRNNANLPDDHRNKLEQEIIAKYTNHCRSSMNNSDQLQAATSTSAPIIEEGEDLADHIILRHLANFRKNNKWRAEQLYTHLKETVSPPQWNKFGQLLDKNDEAIQGSNIVDLINYATFTGLVKKVPSGMIEFIDLIRSSNAPQSFISSSGAQRIADFMENQITGKMDIEEEEEPKENKRPTTRSMIQKKEWLSLKHE